MGGLDANLVPVMRTLRLYRAIYCKYLKGHATEFRHGDDTSQSTPRLLGKLYSFGSYVKETSQCLMPSKRPSGWAGNRRLYHRSSYLKRQGHNAADSWQLERAEHGCLPSAAVVALTAHGLVVQPG